MTLTSTDIGSKNLLKWNRALKGSSNFGSVRVHLFVGTLVNHHVHTHENHKSSKLYMGMYRVLSCSTKSMTLTSTDVGSQKSFKMESNAERLVKFW